MGCCSPVPRTSIYQAQCPDFKALLDSPYRGEIEANATRFPGLYRYGVILSNVAEGIADGSIRVPR